MPGKFVVRHRQGGQFHFVLVAENRQVVATSETYTTKRRCLEGIESVKGLRPTRRWMTRRRSRRLGRRRSGFNSRHLRRASAAAGRSRGARRRGGRYRPRPVKTISAVSTTWPEVGSVAVARSTARCFCPAKNSLGRKPTTASQCSPGASGAGSNTGHVDPGRTPNEKLSGSRETVTSKFTVAA